MDYTGFWVTVGGTIATLAGLLYTVRAARNAERQASSARSAADAAKDAADRASETIAERTTIADLTALRGGFQSVIGLLEANRPELALFEVRLARQRVNEIRQRPGFEGPVSELQAVVTDLAGLQELLEERQYNTPQAPLPLTDISKSLFTHVDRISSWAEQMRYNSKVTS